jgi:hypothetical protein
MKDFDNMIKFRVNQVVEERIKLRMDQAMRRIMPKKVETLNDKLKLKVNQVVENMIRLRTKKLINAMIK